MNLAKSHDLLYKIEVNRKATNLTTLSATKVVSAIHKGPYNEVGVAHTRLFEYIEENNMELARESRSLYLNGPDEVSEEELLTEAQLPIG